MEKLDVMKAIPLDFPREVVEEAERLAVGFKRFVGYLQAVENDILLRVFAFRQLKGKEMQITEVMRRITGEKKCIYKNLYVGGMQSYQAVYEKKDKTISSYGFPLIQFHKDDFDVWYTADAQLGIWYYVLNAEMLKDTSYRYCGYRKGVTEDVIGYLDEYIKHPGIEHFGKLGIKPTPSLIKKAEKDSAFGSWLYRNRDSVWRGGPKVLLYAYDHNMSIDDARKVLHDIDYVNKIAARKIPEIKGTKLDRRRVLDYVNNNGIAGYSYSDYLKALKKLKLDLTDTKNIYPYDFNRMHDIRIAEYESVMAKENAEAEKILNENFEKKAQKAKKFEYQSEDYAVIVPSRTSDLVAEGKALHHCVGKMGYDKKMADGEIVIVFIRSVLDMLTPLLTVEWDLKKKRIRQVHGDHNRAPTEQERVFVNEWATMAEKIRKF